jgi:spore coat protein U-like protein
MVSGGVSISYNLYQNAAYTSPFTYPGNTVFTAPYSNTTGLSVNGPIYGMILSSPAGIPPGTYTDSYTTASQALVNPDGTAVTYSVAENCTGTTGTNWYNTVIFTVSVTVVASCDMSVSAMNFGSTPGPIAANVDSTATITALCTATTPYAIGLDSGQHATGSQRRMQSAASNNVSYGLYTDVGRTQAWSSGASATTCTNGAGTCALGTGTGASQNITIYGRVPPQTLPAAGTYTDTVVVSLTY